MRTHSQSREPERRIDCQSDLLCASRRAAYAAAHSCVLLDDGERDHHCRTQHSQHDSRLHPTEQAHAARVLCSLLLWRAERRTGALHTPAVAQLQLASLQALAWLQRPAAALRRVGTGVLLPGAVRVCPVVVRGSGQASGQLGSAQTSRNSRAAIARQRRRRRQREQERTYHPSPSRSREPSPP